MASPEIKTEPSKDTQEPVAPIPTVAKIADSGIKAESPQSIPQQLTTTSSIAFPDSKTPTPQPLKKAKSSSTSTPAAAPAASAAAPNASSSVPEFPSDLNAADVIGGSPLRKYINQHLTAELIKGIKSCVAVRPERPLRWLGEWLIARDGELQGETEKEDDDDKDTDTKMEE